MKKSSLFLLLIPAILLFASLALWARPFTIKCPIDGEPMSFDHQVGFGDGAVCWYSHYGTDPETGTSSKHQAYISCDE